MSDITTWLLLLLMMIRLELGIDRQKQQSSDCRQWLQQPCK
jgi:hypothetical protein